MGSLQKRCGVRIDLTLTGQRGSSPVGHKMLVKLVHGGQVITGDVNPANIGILEKAISL